jgi:hypothetical protein
MAIAETIRRKHQHFEPSTIKRAEQSFIRGQFNKATDNEINDRWPHPYQARRLLNAKTNLKGIQLATRQFFNA